MRKPEVAVARCEPQLHGAPRKSEFKSEKSAMYVLIPAIVQSAKYVLIIRKYTYSAE